MNMSNDELKVINFLGKNNNLFKYAKNNRDKIITEDTEKLLRSALGLDFKNISRLIESLDKKNLIVLYFDSAYIQLNDDGEKIYNSEK